jgi:hypothetical protein
MEPFSVSEENWQYAEKANELLVAASERYEAFFNKRFNFSESGSIVYGEDPEVEKGFPIGTVRFLYWMLQSKIIDLSRVVFSGSFDGFGIPVNCRSSKTFFRDVVGGDLSNEEDEEDYGFRRTTDGVNFSRGRIQPGDVICEEVISDIKACLDVINITASGTFDPGLFTRGELLDFYSLGSSGKDRASRIASAVANYDVILGFSGTGLGNVAYATTVVGWRCEMFLRTGYPGQRYTDGARKYIASPSDVEFFAVTNPGGTTHSGFFQYISAIYDDFDKGYPVPKTYSLGNPSIVDGNYYYGESLVFDTLPPIPTTEEFACGIMLRVYSVTKFTFTNGVYSAWEHGLGPGCETACETACQTACTSSCQESCTLGCETTCELGCQNECTTGCEADCEAACTEACELGCEFSCQAACTEECTVSCTTDCEAACTDACTAECTAECTDSCTAQCTASCTDECTDSCTTGCTAFCELPCTAACTADCTSWCTTACTVGCTLECTTHCQMHCQMACEFGGCETTCEAECQESGCQTGCQLACQPSIEAFCETYCQAACELACETECEAGCESVCETGCETACELGCETACELGCETACEAGCQTACELGCETACEAGCETACELGCETACESACQSACESGCEEACESDCQTACEAGCQTDCEADCQTACEAGCETECELDCQTACELDLHG